MSIEAMKLALDALELWFNHKLDEDTAWQAHTSLRQAIAEAEKQEPHGYFRYDIRLDAWVQSRDSNKGVSFYTHPPKREPLMDEMIKQMKERYYDLEMRGAFADGWINAESAHGIKGEA